MLILHKNVPCFFTSWQVTQNRCSERVFGFFSTILGIGFHNSSYINNDDKSVYVVAAYRIFGSGRNADDRVIHKNGFAEICLV